MNEAANRATRLKALIAPECVALIGASSATGKLTARPLTFMRRHGFAGRVVPVNPTRSTVMELKAYPSVKEIPGGAEHAYILLDAERAIVAIEDCARAGVKVVSVLADGFAESGSEGLALQERLVGIANDAGILLIGPNSTGVVVTSNGFSCTTNAAFARDDLKQGRLAVLSQSGSLIGTIQSRGQARGIGFSSFISVGNEAAAGIGELGDLLLDDPGTDGFVLFLETIRNRDAVSAFARRAAQMGKPIIAYMIGKSDDGRALAVSHTGALTGSAEAMAAYLRDIGIRQVDTFETLIEAPSALSRIKLSADRPRSVTVVSTTGGGGAMLIDQIGARGVQIAQCSSAAQAKFRTSGIPYGRGKLVDVTLAGANYETMRTVISTLQADPTTGLLVIAIGSSAQFQPELAVKPIVDAWKESPAGSAPIIAFPLPHAPESLMLLNDAGIPSFGAVESCAETVSLLMNTPDRREARPLPDFPEAARKLLEASPPGIMDEVDAGAVFEALGGRRPRQYLLDPAAPVPDVLPFDYPVVVKLVSPDLPHKTDAGAIRLGIPDRHALTAAIAAMDKSASSYKPGYRLKSVIVQEMCRGLGEVLIGLTRDPLVGPVLTVGMGGVMTEIYRDTAVRPAPVSVDTAGDMLKEVKGMALLRGFRGKPRGDLDALAHTISCVSMLALSDSVAEAEINPVLVLEEGKGVVLLDALISHS